MSAYRYLPTKNAAKFLIILLGLMASFRLQAQFNCSSSAYLFQGGPSTAYEVDLATGDFFPVKHFTIKINALGYHPFDDHLYGWDQTNKKIVKINGDFVLTESIDPPAPIADLSFAVGDILSTGDYVLYHPGTDKLYILDLSTRPPSILNEFDVNLGDTWDLAASPVDGNLYGLSRGGNLNRIDPLTGSVTNLGKPSPLVSNQVFGACYFDGDGNFYASGNRTGMIYRIMNAHDLGAGANPPADEFAQGPASGTNDGVKCPFSDVSPEGCANGIDDDGDGLVDCDDGDCADSPACTTSGGGGGGLETNGNLSAKIATRDFWNAKYNIDLEDVSNLPKVSGRMNVGHSATINFRENHNIVDFMPVDVIEGTNSYESSPEDLMDLANAAQVEAVDVFLDNRRVGAVLGIKSTNGIYQHSKYVCDRVKGAQILKTDNIALVGQDSFPVTYFKNINGGREYSTLFAVYENENNEFVVESHWNTDAYPEGATFYNFQVWANSVTKLAKLTERILENLEQKLPIAAINWTRIPQVVVRQHWYENETWNLIVANKSGVKKATFKGLKAVTETDPRIEEEIVLNLNGNPLDTIQVPIQFYTLGGAIATSEDESKDQVYVGNGSWGLSYDEEKSTIDYYDVSQSSRSQGLGTASLIERNVSVQGQIKGELTIFRTIQNAAIPKNFSNFNQLAFELEGNQEVEIVLNKASIDKWSEQPRLNVQTAGKCQQVYVSKDDFYQPNGLTEWNDIKSIAFVFKGGTEKEESVELEIRNVAFANLAEIPECNSFNRQEVMAFPNPMKNELNLILSAGGIENYTLLIRNQLGQLVARQEGQTSPEGRVQFVKTDLENGMYYYSIQLESGSYTGKVVVEHGSGS